MPKNYCVCLYIYIYIYIYDYIIKKHKRKMSYLQKNKSWL